MTARPPKKQAADLVLRLYVAGNSPNSALAKAHLRAALACVPAETVSLEIIDVLVDTARAIRDGVLVTPTLIKLSPEPQQRMIGSLRNISVLADLAIGVLAHD